MRRLALLVLSLAIGCGSDSATDPVSTPASLAGTWSLHDINGILLPIVLTQTSTTKTEMLSDVVTATTAGTYTQVTQVRTTMNGQVTMSSASDTGTYTLTGSAVVVRSGGGSTINGTVKGNTFTIAANGIALEYHRQ